MTDVIYFAENGTYYRVTQEEVPYCFGSYLYYIYEDYSCDAYCFDPGTD
jgi:hypothetical protein